MARLDGLPHCYAGSHQSDTQIDTLLSGRRVFCDGRRKFTNTDVRNPPSFHVDHCKSVTQVLHERRVFMVVPEKKSEDYPSMLVICYRRDKQTRLLHR